MLEFTGLCAGCDRWTTLDDIGLCDTYAAKFDRDLIRQRVWDYSATAFGCDPKDYEALRQAVIEQYGPAVVKILPTAAYRSLLALPGYRPCLSVHRLALSVPLGQWE